MPHIDFEKLQKNNGSSSKLGDRFYIFTKESHSSVLTDTSTRISSFTAVPDATNTVRFPFFSCRNVELSKFN